VPAAFNNIVGLKPSRGLLVRAEWCQLAVRSLVEIVPPPLTIGTLRLWDGQLVKGFLCESIGAEQAQDISRFGGWRNYLQSTAQSQAPVD
jgi:allophanate hydrolase